MAVGAVDDPAAKIEESCGLHVVSIVWLLRQIGAKSDRPTPPERRPPKCPLGSSPISRTEQYRGILEDRPLHIDPNPVMPRVAMAREQFDGETMSVPIGQEAIPRASFTKGTLKSSPSRSFLYSVLLALVLKIFSLMVVVSGTIPPNAKKTWNW